MLLLAWFNPACEATYMVKRLVLLSASLAFVACTGCGVPLMIAVVPCVGSGETVTIRDRHDKPIHANGLLLVRRCKEWGIGKPVSTTRVVDVRNGIARLPGEWVPASIWLPFPGVDSLCFFLAHGAYIHALAQLPAVIVPGTPHIMPAGETLALVPLIPGYAVDVARTGWPGMSGSRGKRIRRIQWKLTDCRAIPRTAIEWWKDVRCRLRHGYEASSAVDFRCSRMSEYDRAGRLIDAEIGRLEGVSEPREREDRM